MRWWPLTGSCRDEWKGKKQLQGNGKIIPAHSNTPGNKMLLSWDAFSTCEHVVERRHTDEQTQQLLPQTFRTNVGCPQRRLFVLTRLLDLFVRIILTSGNPPSPANLKLHQNCIPIYVMTEQCVSCSGNASCQGPQKKLHHTSPSLQGRMIKISKGWYCLAVHYQTENPKPRLMRWVQTNYLHLERRSRSFHLSFRAPAWWRL